LFWMAPILSAMQYFADEKPQHWIDEYLFYLVNGDFDQSPAEERLCKKDFVSAHSHRRQFCEARR
jgi:hypothetical protein